jgi:hypothetical protein
MLQIREILVRIRIQGFVPVTNGSGLLTFKTPKKTYIFYVFMINTY